MGNPNYEEHIIFKSNVEKLEGYYVYVFWDDQTPFYVGLGQKNRWRHHFHNSHDLLMKNNSYKHRKLRKIIDTGGKVGVEIVEQGLSKEEAQDLEIYLISKYKRRCDGGTLTNMSTGGESGAAGRKHTEDFKKNHSKILRGQHSKVTEDLVYKAKLLFHYRGMSPKEIQKLKEFQHVKAGTINSWISKGHPNYSYVAPHLKCDSEIWDEKREEVLKLWGGGKFNYTQISEILGLTRHFVSRTCRGVK